MLKVIFFLSLLMTVLSCKEKTKVHEEGYYKFLTYGLPNFERLRLEESINEKWKIKNVAVAGCEVTQELLDSVASENKKTDVALQKKYGKDWRVKYEKDIQDLVMKEVDIMDILITNKLFRSELEKCKIEIDGVYKTVKAINNSGLYKVDIEKPYPENGICFTVNVNTKNRTVQLIK